MGRIEMVYAKRTSKKKSIIIVENGHIFLNEI